MWKQFAFQKSNKVGSIPHILGNIKNWLNVYMKHKAIKIIEENREELYLTSELGRLFYL